MINYSTRLHTDKQVSKMCSVIYFFDKLPKKFASKLKSVNVSGMNRKSNLRFTRERFCSRDDFESARANKPSVQ